MKLRKARIRGFQAFGDSGEMEFADGINLIVGQNNAGKSALLRALLPELADDRHRTLARWETFKLPQPSVALTIEADGAGIRDWMLRSAGTHHLPMPVNTQQSAEDFTSQFFERSRVRISINRVAGSAFAPAGYPSHGLFADPRLASPRPESPFAAVVTIANGELTVGLEQSSADSLLSLTFRAWQREMFYFTAERMRVGASGSGWADRLHPNAANLPNVLHTLSAERGDVFQRLVCHVGDVFPTVGNLSVRTAPEANQLEVRVWPTKAMERVELSFPLNSSGTGVAQVIALLTAIMTVDNAVIIIDEINSFLHPAAVKCLLRIIQTQYMQHQYIISTHSPDVISFSNPKTIHLVKRDGYESSVEPLDLSKVEKLREVAQHLGVSMADVFAAERVIWVEGATEELCFPYLHEALVGPLPRRTLFTAVAATGDLTRKRDREIVYEVYRRLSGAAAPLVVSVVFSFDTEELTDSEKREMRREAGGSLHFLPRRHLECYLVDPGAIAAFIVSKDPVSAGAATSATVEEALRNAAARDPFLVQEWTGDITDEGWLARVDAAGLIGAICGVLSDQRVRFNKKDDSLFLLRHMVEHNPERLARLKAYVESLVEAVTPGEEPTG